MVNRPRGGARDSQAGPRYGASPSPVTTRPRGQHAGLSAPAIVRTAIRIADEDGLSALSMRRLGTDLHVEAMALYHYFPNKAALLDAVVEELATSVPVVDFTDVRWDHGLTSYARAQLDSLTEHPNLIELVMSRPAVTSGNLAALETLVGFLCDAGFTTSRALDMVYAVNEVVLMHAALETGFGRAATPRGEQGQYAQLASVSAEEYPHLAEAVRTNRDRVHGARFDVVLEALIAGFSAMDDGRP